jgi:uncharacterized protein
MKARPLDPTRLDVAAFAKDGGTLEGSLSLTSLERLAESAHPESSPLDTDQASWSARGESRPVRGGEPEIWLHLGAKARISLICQRCLGPVETPLEAECSFRFVAGEEAAAQLDADSEDDVLALPRSLDLSELIEDELLLAVPIVPRHDVCPQPLPMPQDDELEEEPAPNPFAALAALKRGGPPN